VDEAEAGVVSVEISVERIEGKCEIAATRAERAEARQRIQEGKVPDNG